MMYSTVYIICTSDSSSIGISISITITITACSRRVGVLLKNNAHARGIIRRKQAASAALYQHLRHKQEAEATLNY